ncbi:MAG: PilZ domain-containing protein [Candidatus Omnitrophica bacterium]|nr:PilZ domain-containing protein [Candidatus Omnitrophota bacterium]
MQERRRFVRIPERLAIAYKILPSDKPAGFLTKNISQAGLRFFVHDFVKPASLLEVRVSFEKVRFSLEAIARVVWVEKEAHSERYEVGVEFATISKKAASQLISYIETILKTK